MTPPMLRLATEEDLASINDIYNYYVEFSTSTYQLQAEPLHARTAWFHEHHPDRYPVTVVELEGRVVAWGSLSKFRERDGYWPTVECSVYVDHRYHRRGLGRMILADLIVRARRAGFHSIIGGISADQTPSVALHAALGFHKTALLKQVGIKFGRWLDVIYMQLMLD